mmetsp:Transcript_14084/g.22320  ORF Transcript_14084/g.22320 Transcript_14084/m.22320 type:complete len:245 (+) Transcript_14084:481-1215(+)
MDKLSDSVTDVDEPHELFAVQYRRRSNVLVDEDLGEIPHAVRRRDGDELIFRRHDFGGGYVCHVATCGRECLQDNVLFRQDSLEVKRIFLGTRHDKEARFVLPHRDCDVPGGGIDGARGPAPRSIHQVHDEACYSSLCVRLVKFLARDHAVLDRYQSTETQSRVKPEDRRGIHVLSVEKSRDMTPSPPNMRGPYIHTLLISTRSNSCSTRLRLAGESMEKRLKATEQRGETRARRRQARRESMG